MKNQPLKCKFGCRRGAKKEGGGGYQGLGQVCDRGCQEAATSWRSWNCAGENLTPSQRRNVPMAALGTVQVHFPAPWRTQTSLKRCKAQQGHPVWPFPWREAAALKEDSCPCSPGEEEGKILWAGPGREVQQEGYTSSGSQVRTIKVQAVK